MNIIKQKTAEYLKTQQGCSLVWVASIRFRPHRGKTFQADGQYSGRDMLDRKVKGRFSVVLDQEFRVVACEMS